MLSYFLHNPEGADSLEGVARWRLREEVIQRSVDEIDRALAWLVAEGLLFRESSRGSVPIFRLNRARAFEAERFLATTKGP